MNINYQYVRTVLADAFPERFGTFMMRKEVQEKRPFWKPLGKAIVVFEVSLLGYSYFTYRRLNRSEGLRYHFSKKYPWMLNVYYEIGERIGGLDTRQTDLERWKTYERNTAD